MTSNNIDTTIEYTVSKFGFHQFREQILDRKIIVQVVGMQDSLLIYVNDKEDNHFSDLALAMKNRHDNTPISTKLVGNDPEEYSKSVAGRLSKKTGKVIYLSCNIPHDRTLIPLIEKRILEEIKLYPDKFQLK